MRVEGVDRRQEAHGRRVTLPRRNTQRRVDHRRDGIRRTTLVNVSPQRRELSDRRLRTRRDGLERRGPEDRRHGARRSPKGVLG